MPLRKTARSLACIFMAASALAMLASCAKDPLRLDRNRPPRTFLVAAPIDSTISHPTATGVAYSYRVHLYWRGEDPDGYVVGFLWAFDDSSAGHYHFTTKTDSIFDLTVNDSTDITGGATVIGFTRFHTFFIRAVDNLGKPDPNLAIFNRTTFKASTERPRVQFIGDLPSLAARDSARVDTLSLIPGPKGAFKVCWTGDDPDGNVIRYKYDVGTFSSPLVSDTCAFFNDPGNPNSIALGNGIYNLTVTAVDNALAVGKTNFFFVVNHDPETWFLPKGNPNGYYHPPFLGGELVDESVVFPFAVGDTIPYRSTVWFYWDGEDLGRPGTPNNLYPESNCVNAYSLELRGGTRNNGEPYVIGFVDSIPTGTGNVPFKTNEPSYLHQAGGLYHNFVLDSLDPGFDLNVLAAARDCASRGDGTKAAFRFSCNFRPFIDSLSVLDDFEFLPGGGVETGKRIYWFSHDLEDGKARRARILLDSNLQVFTPPGSESYFVADSTFARLQPYNPHSVRVWVIDRAEFVSDSSLTYTFDLVSPADRPTRRP
jgi:hypothetical protein